jgi:hypothetical protein
MPHQVAECVDGDSARDCERMDGLSMLRAPKPASMPRKLEPVAMPRSRRPGWAQGAGLAFQRARPCEPLTLDGMASRWMAPGGAMSGFGW